jgi:CSLREA domain-containing protein
MDFLLYLTIYILKISGKAIESVPPIGPTMNLLFKSGWGLGLLFLSLNTAEAVTFTVNTTVDAVDANIGNGTCVTAGGLCSLRAAIQEANALAGDDVIVLPASATAYKLTIFGTDDVAAKGDLDITSNLTITGGGASTTAIDGNGAAIGDRVFHILGGTPTVIIENVTIANGRAPVGSPGPVGGNGGSGGGILVAAGTVTLTNGTVHSNATGNGGLGDAPLFLPGAGGNGGGIAITGGTLTINTSTIRNNTTGNGLSSGCGGGISISGGTVAINRSTINNNTTSNGLDGSIVFPGAMGGFGAGLCMTTGTVTVSNSTFSRNTTGNGGNGSGVAGMPGGDGGGISASAGNLTLNNVTISENATGSGGTGTPAGAGGSGGGISRAVAIVNLRNTVIANNTVAAGGANPDCSGALTSQGFNILKNGTGCTGLTEGSNNDRVGVDPMLDAAGLADNGGPTQTITLLTGSPAIDTGDNALCETVDQRGQARPTDGDRNGTATCDRGALEITFCGDLVVQSGEGCDDGNTNDNDACRNTCVSATCGDGVVQTDVEECDDGNTVDDDDCTNTCLLPEAEPAVGSGATGGGGTGGGGDVGGVADGSGADATDAGGVDAGGAGASKPAGGGCSLAR